MSHPNRLRRRLVAAGFAAAVSLAPVAASYELSTPAAAAPADATAATAATSAGSWLATQFTGGKYVVSSYTGKADVSTTADAVIGLAASGTSQDVAKSADAWLQTQASSDKTTGGLAAKLVIVAEAMGDDPTNYGGVDLVNSLTNSIASAKGNDLGGPYANALAVIALHRAGVQVPAGLEAALLAEQDASGEFHFGTVGKSDYFADPDSTGVAIAALADLSDAKASAALAKADAWAVKNRLAAGYWKSFSPVNTTGLVGSALAAQKKGSATSLTWMEGQQVKGGGLPASLGGTDADAYATAQGLLLLGGVTLNDVSLQAAASPSPTPSSASSAATSPAPATSSPAPSSTSTAPTTTAPTTSMPLPATGDHAAAASPSQGTETGVALLVGTGVLLLGGAVVTRRRR